MENTKPLIFVGIMALSVAIPLLVALFNNHKAYSNEPQSARREAIAADGFGLTIPVAVAIVAVLFIGYRLFA